MDKETCISFVMPAFNAGDTIEEAVDSIMRTNFEPRDELIIVDDGSTDNTEKEILKLQKKYPHIRYIKNERNIGCPATRNVGIRASGNNLIFNMDADDVLAPNSVKNLKKCLISEDADMATFAESRYFRKNTNLVTHKTVTRGGPFTLADHLSSLPGPGGNCIYTKASWERIGGYDELGKGLHEYWGFFLKQLAHDAKIVVLKDSFYFHRYGKKSLYVRETKKQNESSRVATTMIMPYLDLLHKDDATYIQSEAGLKNWFIELSTRPIRVKSGEIGVQDTEFSYRMTKLYLKRLKL